MGVYLKKKSAMMGTTYFYINKKGGKTGIHYRMYFESLSYSFYYKAQIIFYRGVIDKFQQILKL